MLQNLVLLSVAGAMGTLTRYGMSELVSHLVGRKFPWSTLSINLLGSFLFGLVWTLADGATTAYADCRTGAEEPAPAPK